MIFILFVQLSFQWVWERKGDKIFSRCNVLNWRPPIFDLLADIDIKRENPHLKFKSFFPDLNLERKRLLLCTWKFCFKFGVSFPCIWSHNWLGIKMLPEINRAIKIAGVALALGRYHILRTQNRTSQHHQKKFNVNNFRVVWEQSTVLDRDFKCNMWVFGF